MRHPYFRELREQEKRAQALTAPEHTISAPPASGDSSVSGRHNRKGNKGEEEGTLPMISGKTHGENSDKENDDDESSGGKTKITGAFHHISFKWRISKKINCWN